MEKKKGAWNMLLIRSDRRTTAMEISPKGELILRCPRDITEEEIRRLVDENWDWIQKATAAVMEQQKKREVLTGSVGSSLPLWGERVPVKEGDGCDVGIAMKNGIIYIAQKQSEDEKRGWIRTLYKKIAEEYFEKNLQSCADQMGGLKFGSVKVTNAKTRWGSCSAEGNICFSWRLMAVDQAAILYVMVHELCHLKYMNHSRDFWNMVSGYLPDYERRKKILKDFSKKYDWGEI